MMMCVCRKLVKSPHDERSLVGRCPIVLKLLRPPCSPHLRSAEASSVPQKKKVEGIMSARGDGYAKIKVTSTLQQKELKE